MDTWKEKNPDFEYICWSEEEIEKRQIVFKCQEKIDEIDTNRKRSKELLEKIFT
jgi:hypothetical protein